MIAIIIDIATIAILYQIQQDMQRERQSGETKERQG
jgi:hypothetical protein